MSLIELLKWLPGLFWGKLKKWTASKRKLAAENKRLREALALKGNLQREHSAYWLKDDQGNTIDGPFCMVCFDDEQATRRLVQGGKPSGEAGRPRQWVQCPKCRVAFRQEHVGVYLNTH